MIAVLALTMLLGMAALAIDVGYWFQTKRHDQAVVDAAALAGAQALPDDPSTALSLALDYASRNGVTIDASNVSISNGLVPNDTISVSYAQPSPGVFSSVFGLTSVNASAHASARAGLPGEARYVAPIVVSSTNPLLGCSPPPCSGSTQIDLINLHQSGSGNAAGAFALLDLIQNDNGNVGAGTLAGWMLNGDSNEMPLGIYNEAPSANFNNSQFQTALQSRVGDVVLFPVYQPPILGGGSNGQFNIIGWVGFHIDSESARGSSGVLNGHFTRYIAQGLQATSGGGGGGGSSNDFGVRVVQLTE